MKKYLLIISTLTLLSASNSCSERDLELFPPTLDEITGIDTSVKLQQMLNGAYLTMSSTSIYGTKAMVFGDIMGDKMFVNSNPSFLNTHNFNYNSAQQEEFGGFYSGLYSAIANCNLVINNTVVANDDNVVRMKAEAKIVRALAYYTLVNYYSPSPTSGINQKYGVPLVLENYDVNMQPGRATVAQVYDQIISDLKDGILHAEDMSKLTLGPTAAKLLLSRVYLTRRASGDAQLALQLATEVRDLGMNTPGTFATGGVGPIAATDYNTYYTAMDDGLSEEQPETVWELHLDKDTNRANGIGANISLPGYYYRLDPKKAFLFNQTFYGSFAATDVRRGPSATVATSMLTQVGAPPITVDTPRGYWTSKYPQVSNEGRYYRNIKILRFSEAYLNRIEALHLTGQDAQALTELNAFAASRSGSPYVGTDMLADILAERSKEFYGEGQRFLDLKRYNLPINRPSNCTVCSLPANDKLFVFPVTIEAMNNNPNLTQYPGYN